MCVDDLVLDVLRPRDSEALLDEEAFEREEFLPYWAELWPSSLALARAVRARALRGRRVVELGCGLGLASVVAALSGGRVLATDWSPDALAFTAENARRNGAALAVTSCDWAQPHLLEARAPWDLVIASDVLYEQRNVELLLALLPKLAGEAWIADPGRPPAERFLATAREYWQFESRPDGRQPRVRLHRLRKADSHGRTPSARSTS